MSSPSKSASPAGEAGSSGQGPEDKPRLTEEEKKQNHIASGTAARPRPLPSHPRQLG